MHNFSCLDASAEAIRKILANDEYSTTQDIMDFINAHPISLRELMKANKINYEKNSNNIIPSNMSGEIISSWGPYEINFSKWLPLIIINNSYSVNDTADAIYSLLYTNIDTLEKDKDDCTTLRDPVKYLRILANCIHNIKYSTNELSDMIKCSCDHFSTKYSHGIRLKLLESMHNQELSIWFIEDEYIKYFSSADTEELHCLIATLPDPMPFLHRYLDVLSPAAVFNNTVLSDTFIINYLMKYGLSKFNTDGVSDVRPLAYCHKFTPALITYLINTEKYSIIDEYQSSFISKPTYLKRMLVKKIGCFTCKQTYFYAYLNVDPDNNLYDSFKFKFEPGKTYETAACGNGIYDDGYIGFSVHDLVSAGMDGSLNELLAPYRPYKIIKIKIKYGDVTYISGYNQVYCSKLTVCNDDN